MLATEKIPRASCCTIVTFDFPAWITKFWQLSSPLSFLLCDLLGNRHAVSLKTQACKTIVVVQHTWYTLNSLQHDLRFPGVGFSFHFQHALDTWCRVATLISVMGQSSRHMAVLKTTSCQKCNFKCQCKQHFHDKESHLKV